MGDEKIPGQQAQGQPSGRSEPTSSTPEAPSTPKALDAASRGNTPSDTPSDRPSDADIITQENEIREAEAIRIPFLGDMEELTALAAEYEGGSEVFRTKIHSLSRDYSGFRRSRGDGNCFFRAFVFAYLDNLIATGDYSERSRVLSQIQEIRKKLLDCGYQELVFEDSQQHLLNQLNSIKVGHDGLTQEVLLINMRDSEVSNMIVSFLRLATSAELASRAEFFAPFIMGMTADELTVEAFRRRCVEPMGEEADHVHIVALCDMLQVSVRVLYLDRTMDTTGGNGSTVNEHDFVPEALAEAAKKGDSTAAARVVPRVHLLYRPGHYDILTPKPSAALPNSTESAAATGGLDDLSVSRSIAATLAAVQGISDSSHRGW